MTWVCGFTAEFGLATDTVFVLWFDTYLRTIFGVIMPLTELVRMFKGKVEVSQDGSSNSIDPSSR